MTAATREVTNAITVQPRGDGISVFADDWTFEIGEHSEDGGTYVMLRLGIEHLTWRSAFPFQLERFTDDERVSNMVAGAKLTTGEV